MKCDHDKCTTPFCPQCGEPVLIVPGTDVLTHCLKTSDHQKIMYDNAVKGDLSDRTVTGRLEKYKKWDRWSSEIKVLRTEWIDNRNKSA